MGIIKAVTTAVGGALADQWLEAVEPDDMGDRTVFVRGVQVRRGKGSNTKGSSDIVSDGSVIHVYPNQFMMLVDGGKIVDYTAEEGYYKVSHSSMPSMFNGQFGEALKESFNRIRFGGVTPGSQKVYYVNLQEIKGIKFGTRNPVNYFDNFYNAELFLRAHGTYSIKVTDPIKFYAEVIPKNADHVEIDSINEQYLSEFLEALQTSINQMSADGTRISYVTSRSRELGQYMAQTLDEEWTRMRGMEIQAVGIASITYDEESQNLINLRNRGAMMSDPSIREGYVQTTIAEGLKNAGSNDSGAMAGFMGMGMGMQMGGGFMGAASNTNMQQMQMNQVPGQMPGNTGMPGMGGHPTGGQPAGNQPMGGQPAGGQPMGGQPSGVQPAGSQWAVPNQMAGMQPGSAGMAGQMPGTQPGSAWTCPGCGTSNTGKFCGECGHPRPDTPWTCACGNINTGKFCSECGKPRP
ncbi:SPFH domain-containing protein [Enterocloster sp.]|jgi:membrane protease subunit (stomatin/prohibitin family)|uniref:SPFH domain-containing protein n=1 Tax=Enterocloster sp. TaxID=2719315 RepID=UPI00257F349B|nr:SPFH domain-containing protein [Enterocloster sp.]MBS5404216.1 SPFH domain-containing protein [Enterocloster sp.]